ncbi:NACHT, LRR and PYD domains-containing protein 3-like [Exaiptasia diaphana]|uniref:NACHT domain-containing protein n=1 Tax=Exaiptasia diaphana TaxID=2652724 RepID=A0A913YE37_EXADI|nr:NACHT, LRR and PYD domains-containing protein 3-like [Exaiptasia diaphana]
MRLVLGIIHTIILQMHYHQRFPVEFRCELNFLRKRDERDNITDSNLYDVDIGNCHNSVGSEKSFWVNVMFGVQITLVLLIKSELLYLVYKVCMTGKHFITDSEFCERYLLRMKKTVLIYRTQILEQTKFEEALIEINTGEPGQRVEKQEVDDIYVDVIIHSGRVIHHFEKAKRHENLNVHLRIPENSVIGKHADFFDDSILKVLVVGRPGIGKSLLCTMLLRESLRGQLLQEFTSVFLFRFRQLNSELTTKMTLEHFLKKADLKSGDVDLQYIVNNASKVLIIFDGFDEFHAHDSCLIEAENCAGNDVSNEIPVSAFLVKLLQNKLLPGAKIVLTTRPNVVETAGIWKLFCGNNCNGRELEILGFTPDKVHSYVKTYCGGDSAKAETMWQQIHSNINLRYLCYIPVTCKIVCILLDHHMKNENTCQESTTNSFTRLTEVYQQALEIFLSNHYRGKEQTKRKSTDSCTFSETLQKPLAELGEVAYKGLEDGRLIFEEDEVSCLDSCGLLHCMPRHSSGKKNFLELFQRPPSQYCFIHLTIQEFLSAKYLIDEKVETHDLETFIKAKAEDANWHVVIQFIAGLLQRSHPLYNEVTEVIEDILIESLMTEPLPGSTEGCNAILMLTCLYELNDDEVAKRIASAFTSHGHFAEKGVELRCCSMTPIDCAAVVYFLNHFETDLEWSLDLKSNSNLDDTGCLELAKMVQCGGPAKLNISRCGVSDQGLRNLVEAAAMKDCRLTELDIGGNADVTDQGLSYLSDALKSEDCKLRVLDLHGIVLTDNKLTVLCEALHHPNCKLNEIRISLGVLAYADSHPHERHAFQQLRQALTHESCCLTVLCLWNSQITDEGLAMLCEILIHENCKVNDLNLIKTRVKVQGISSLCQALVHQDCKLTKLNLEEIEVTDECVKSICDMVQNTNFKLNLLNLRNNKFTRQGAAQIRQACAVNDCVLHI